MSPTQKGGTLAIEKNKGEVTMSKNMVEESELKREIGVFGGMSIIAGIMIGAGVFYIGSYVLMRVEMNIGLALLCWVIGGLISLMGGLCFAELGAMMPKAGGSIVYLNDAYHPILGFMSGFSSCFIAGPGSIAGLAIAMVTTMRTFFVIGDTTLKILAVGIIALLTIYNCYGVKKSSTLQNISMIAKLIPIFLIMIAALFMGDIFPDMSFSHVSESAEAAGKSVISMIALAVVATLWAYEGWQNLNTLAEEIKEPQKNLPLAILLGVSGVMVLYLFFNFSIFRVIPLEEIKVMIANGDYYLGTEVAKRMFGNAGAVIVVIGMVLAIFGSLNGLILAGPRAWYALAKEGHFFKTFMYVHPVYKVPTHAIIAQGVISCILVVARSLDQLAILVVFTGMIFKMLTIVTVIIFRKKYPNMDRPYKVIAYPVTVILTILVFFGLIINNLIKDPSNSLLSCAAQIVAVAFYMYFDRKLKKEKAETIE